MFVRPGKIESKPAFAEKNLRLVEFLLVPPGIILRCQLKPKPTSKRPREVQNPSPSWIYCSWYELISGFIQLVLGGSIILLVVPGTLLRWSHQSPAANKQWCPQNWDGRKKWDFHRDFTTNKKVNFEQLGWRIKHGKPQAMITFLVGMRLTGGLEKNQTWATPSDVKQQLENKHNFKHSLGHSPNNILWWGLYYEVAYIFSGKNINSSFIDTWYNILVGTVLVAYMYCML